MLIHILTHSHSAEDSGNDGYISELEDLVFL